MKLDTTNWALALKPNQKSISKRSETKFFTKINTLDTIKEDYVNTRSSKYKEAAHINDFL